MEGRNPALGMLDALEDPDTVGYLAFSWPAVMLAMLRDEMT